MPNEQTSVPLFVANTVLTASQQNLSAGTGVPVFATTVTRDAAFGGSNKALAEGQLCYLSSTNVTQQYNGASWETVGPITAGGMTLISTTTLTGASVSLSAIPQTYKDLQLVVRNYLPATDNANFAIRVNGDSTANRHKAVADSTTPAVQTYNATYWDIDIVGQDNAVGEGLSVYNIYDYTNTTTRKMASAVIQYINATTTTSFNQESTSFFYNQLSAITSLTLLNNSGNFTSGTALLYGIS